MRIDVAGGGPAGLYFAFLMKKTWPDWRIRVIEQNAPDDTFGFGVVLSGRALGFLAEADETVVAHLMQHMETWTDQHIMLNSQRVVIDGSSFSGVSRLVLLQQLQKLCMDVGVVVDFRSKVTPNLARDCDVLVGADGANSAIRDAYPSAFGTQLVELKNYFAWYGVARPYPAHTLTFMPLGEGACCGHHYRYTPGMSTFVAEMDETAWAGSGFETMDDAGRRLAADQIFAQPLGGQPLIDNKSMWRRYRIIKNSTWSHDNIVLVGDALRTAHPSIGSGTRLAIEDSIALWRAFQNEGTDIAGVFARYQSEREPVRDKLNRAAERSIAWYEDMATRLHLHPLDFAWDYMMRTGIMTAERLERDCPLFMAQYKAHAA